MPKGQTKRDCEIAIRRLIFDWARENGVRRGQQEIPSFAEFTTWLDAKGYGHYTRFRSRRGAHHDVEDWFDEELGQTWRN
jgi:hypothetical protein